MSESKTSKHEQATEDTLYGVSDVLVQDVSQAINANDLVAIDAFTDSLHAADVADLIGRLDPEDRRRYIKLVKHRIDPDVLSYIEDLIKEEVLDLVGTRGLAAAIKGLESDDALHLIEDLEPEQQHAVLKAIPAQERAILEEVLTYPKDSAGRLMQREMACVPTFWTVGEVLKFVQESTELPEMFYNIYVVDPRHHPIGVMPLNKLLRQPESLSVEEVMDTNINTVPVTMDQEEVALLFRHYALVSTPVIDDSGRIAGMITVDDVVNVIDKEAEEDILHLAGVSESDFHAPILKTAYWRARWLIVTAISTFIAAAVIAQFQESIEKQVALSFIMVIVAAMGGNSGLQAVTVSVRAIATRELKPGNALKAVRKEFLVAVVSGLWFAVVIGSITALWLWDLGMGLVLAGALLCNMLWAGFAGICLPIITDRIGMDPAISAGPLLSTTTDVIGYAIFLGFATYFLLG